MVVVKLVEDAQNQKLVVYDTLAESRTPTLEIELRDLIEATKLLTTGKLHTKYKIGELPKMPMGVAYKIIHEGLAYWLSPEKKWVPYDSEISIN